MSADNFLIRENTVKSIRAIRPKYLAAIAKAGCDKYGLSFNGDDRFALFKTQLNLSGYLGYYGDSNCSTCGSVGDKKLFEDAFVKYLNSNIDAVLNGVADIIESKLDAERSAYLEKLRAEIARVEATGGAQ